MGNEIVKRIFDTMKSRGVTQKQIAEKLGIGQGTVAGWKQRNCPPPINYISDIAELLDVSIEFLITGNNNPHKLALTDDEWFIIRHYRYTSDINKGKIYSYVLGLTDEEYMKVDHNESIKTF